MTDVCPLCGAGDPKPVKTVAGHDLVQCGCGLMFWSREVPSYMRELRFGLYEKIKDRVPAGAVLDYGGGTGCYTAPLRSYGFTVYVHDPDRAAVNYGVRHFDVKDYATSLLQPQFELIVMNQVVEHFDNPRLEVALAKSLLLPRGLLLIRTGAAQTVPGLGLDHPYLRPEERTFWTLPLLRRLVEAAGLVVEEEREDTSAGYNLETYARKPTQ